jgi:hypothetical protein
MVFALYIWELNDWAAFCYQEELEVNIDDL